jgi:molybdopterin-binding protein
MAFPALALGASTGQITGTVTDASTHNPVEGIEACAYQASDFEWAGCGYTDSSGHYAITGLGTRSYKVEFAPGYESGLDYVSQYYNGKETWEEADLVSVTNGSTTTGINAQMHEGGKITGTVTDASTHSPIEGIEACAYQTGTESYFYNCATTNSSGSYTISGIPTGSFVIQFTPGQVCVESSCTSPNYLHQYYNGKTSYEEADTVSVTEGTTTSNIDAALHEGGRIAGTVTDASTHNPLSGVEVCAWMSGGEYYEACGSTNASGEYTISGLAAGSYTVEFYRTYGTNYLPQYYSGKTPLEQPDTVSVTTGSTTTGVNAALQQGGKITGKVTDASTHNPISGVEVCPSITSAEFFYYYFECAYTNASGEYMIEGLFTGSYKLHFYRPYESGYANQYYDGKTTWGQADTISVTAGSTVSNINAELHEGGKITGVVTDATTHNPIEGIFVCASLVGGEGEGECATTAPGGSYLIKGLPAGSYTVEFRGPYEETDYLPQYYNGKSTSSGADHVSVTEGSTTSGISAELQEGGRITGTVTDAATHTAIEGVEVCASGAAEQYEYFNCVETDGAGNYTFRALPTGSYKVEFSPGYLCGPHSCTSQNYIRQYYNGKATWVAGDSVSVTNGSTTSGINAEMHEGGLITGAVTDASSHDPIAGIEVCAFEPGTGEGGLYRCAGTDESGDYSINGLATGSYDVVFRVNGYYYSPLNYAPQYYNGKPNQAEANPVSVTAGSTTQNINAVMHQGGQITGTVTDATTHNPIEGIEVCVTKIGSEEEYFGCGYTNESGAYAIRSLPSGSYKVAFFQSYYSPAEVKYARQYYNGKTTYEAADSVSVTAGSTTSNVNAAMQEGGRITGTVTDSSTHNALEGAEACAVKPGEEEEYFGCGYTDSSGAYTIAGLPAGTYDVVFYAPYGSSYAVQYYNGKGSIGEATSISVTAGSTTANVNAALAPPTVKPVNTTAPVLGGTPAVGSTLSCSNGTWENGPTGYEYAWLRGSTPIAGASASSYQVQAADQGFSITCEVTAINGAGQATATSNSLSVPPAIGAPVNTVAPVLSGTPSVASTLSCSNGSWENSPTSYAYAWRRDGSLISGQSAGSYTVQAGDAGHGISCEVTAENGSGSNSAPSNTLHIPAKPVNTAAPVLSGTPSVGSSLSCSNGTWENSPTSYAYAWRRDSSLISGQSTGSYTVQTGDAGHGISCEVTATNGGGSASATSNTLNVPTPPSPAPSTESKPTPPPSGSPSGSPGPGLGVASSVAIFKGGAVLVPLHCVGSASCHGLIKLIAKLSAAGHRKRRRGHASRAHKRAHNVVIGKARYSIAAGKRATVHIKLTPKGKALLHHSGKSGLRVALTGTDIKKRMVKIKPGKTGGRHHHRKHR